MITESRIHTQCSNLHLHPNPPECESIAAPTTPITNPTKMFAASASSPRSDASVIVGNKIIVAYDNYL